MRVLTQSNGLVNRGEGIKEGGRRGRGRTGQEWDGEGKAMCLGSTGILSTGTQHLLQVLVQAPGTQLSTQQTSLQPAVRKTDNSQTSKTPFAGMKTGEGTAKCWRLGVAVSATGFCNSTALHILNWITVLQEAGLCIIKYLAILVASPAINRNQ